MNLLELKKILNQVTKGPWTSIVEGRDQVSGSSFIMTGNEENRGYDIEFINIKESDQDFMALSRNISPELIDEIERLRIY